MGKSSSSDNSKKDKKNKKDKQVAQGQPMMMQQPMQQQPMMQQQPQMMQQPMMVVQAPGPKPAPFSSGAWPTEPVQISCPNCGKDCVTKCEGSINMMAWILCIVLCCVGCNLGCCLIPFCLDSCKNFKHTCPQCNNVVGYKQS